jgi:hypothetical protein
VTLEQPTNAHIIYTSTLFDRVCLLPFQSKKNERLVYIQRLTHDRIIYANVHADVYRYSSKRGFYPTGETLNVEPKQIKLFPQRETEVRITWEMPKHDTSIMVYVKFEVIPEHVIKGKEMKGVVIFTNQAIPLMFTRALDGYEIKPVIEIITTDKETTVTITNNAPYGFIGYLEMLKGDTYEKNNHFFILPHVKRAFVFNGVYNGCVLNVPDYKDRFGKRVEP